MDPWSKKIPHVSEELRPCPITIESVHCKKKSCKPQLGPNTAKHLFSFFFFKYFLLMAGAGRKMRQNRGSEALWRNTTTWGKVCHEVKGSLKTQPPCHGSSLNWVAGLSRSSCNPSLPRGLHLPLGTPDSAQDPKESPQKGHGEEVREGCAPQLPHKLRDKQGDSRTWKVPFLVLEENKRSPKMYRGTRY